MQVRHGHHDVVPGLEDLDLPLPRFPTFCALELEDASSHQHVAAKSSPLFYTGHCGYHRYLTKLYIGSVLVSAMYGRSSELGVHCAGAPTARGRWVSPRAVGESDIPIATAGGPPTTWGHFILPPSGGRMSGSLNLPNPCNLSFTELHSTSYVALP